MDINTPRISGKLLYIALADLRQSMIDEHVANLTTKDTDTLIKQVQEIKALSDCLNKMQTDNANASYGYILESYKYPPSPPRDPMMRPSTPPVVLYANCDTTKDVK